MRQIAAKIQAETAVDFHQIQMIQRYWSHRCAVARIKRQRMLRDCQRPQLLTTEARLLPTLLRAAMKGDQGLLVQRKINRISKIAARDDQFVVPAILERRDSFGACRVHRIVFRARHILSLLKIQLNAIRSKKVLPWNTGCGPKAVDHRIKLRL